MTKIDKLNDKFNKKPIPSDIEFKDVKTLFEHYGCVIDEGGNHPKVVYKQKGIIIPIAGHKKYVPEYNVKQLKELLSEIRGDE